MKSLPSFSIVIVPLSGGTDNSETLSVSTSTANIVLSSEKRSIERVMEETGVPLKSRLSFRYSVSGASRALFPITIS